MKIEEFENSEGTISVQIAGKPLTCLVCGNQEYEQRESLLNTRAGELFGLAWTDEKATNYICAHCGYIFWFLR